MFVFLSIAKEGKHSNNQYTVTINTLSLANLILVKMLPHKYGKPTPFAAIPMPYACWFVCPAQRVSVTFIVGIKLALQSKVST